MLRLLALLVPQMGPVNTKCTLSKCPCLAKYCATLQNSVHPCALVASKHGPARLHHAVPMHICAYCQTAWAYLLGIVAKQRLTALRHCESLGAEQAHAVKCFSQRSQTANAVIAGLTAFSQRITDLKSLSSLLISGTVGHTCPPGLQGFSEAGTAKAREGKRTDKKFTQQVLSVTYSCHSFVRQAAFIYPLFIWASARTSNKAEARKSVQNTMGNPMKAP